MVREASLKEAFPRLYAISNQKDCSIREVRGLGFGGGGVILDLSPSTCIICGVYQELALYLFAKCQFSLKVWNVIVDTNF